jgi:hypothetical protein
MKVAVDLHGTEGGVLPGGLSQGADAADAQGVGHRVVRILNLNGGGKPDATDHAAVAAPTRPGVPLGAEQKRRILEGVARAGEKRRTRVPAAVLLAVDLATQDDDIAAKGGAEASDVDFWIAIRATRLVTSADFALVVVPNRAAGVEGSAEGFLAPKAGTIR